MGIFQLVENLGLVLVLGILMIAQSTELSILTFILFFFIPFAMLLFIYIRHPETERRDRLVFRRQTEMLILVHQVTDNTRLICDYFQKPDTIVGFNERVAACNRATTLATMFRVTNQEFAPLMTTIVIAVYVVSSYASVTNKTITIGEFLTFVAVWRSIGGAYQKAYTDMLKVQQAAAPLLNIIHYMNLPVDTLERLEVNREMLALGFIAQSQAHEQIFSGKKATSSLVDPGSIITLNGKKVEARYPQDIVQISGEDINFSYPSRPQDAGFLLEGASFTIPQGQLVAIAGPKGCGKKTLLELIGGVLLPSGPSKLFVPPHLRVLHVSKNPQILPEISLFENLTFGPSDGQDEEPERVLEICRRLGLSQHAIDLVEKSRFKQDMPKKPKVEDNSRRTIIGIVSGSVQSMAMRELQEKTMAPEQGLPYTEKCLLHIARALVMNPEVLILHKPLEHFDNIFARRVVDLLREFVDLRGIEKSKNTLHLRRPRTCIFSVGQTNGLEDVDMLLQVSNRKVEKIDLVSLCRLKQEVGSLFNSLDRNVDNLLDREEFASLAETSDVEEAKRQLNRIFDVVDDSGGGKVDFEELMAFIREQFDDNLEEAVHALQHPSGVAEKLARKKAVKAALLYKDLDAWDSPEVPQHTTALGFPSTSTKVPVTPC